MTAVLSALAQLIHAALVLAAAPLLRGVVAPERVVLRDPSVMVRRDT